jgi:hypothetical protein
LIPSNAKLRFGGKKVLKATILKLRREEAAEDANTRAGAAGTPNFKILIN